VGEHTTLLSRFPEKERQIWLRGRGPPSPSDPIPEDAELIIESHPPILQRLIHSTRSSEIPAHITDATDGLVTLWISHQSGGLPADNVYVRRVGRDGFDPATGLPAQFSEVVAPYWDTIEREIGRPNKGKVWISKYRLDMSDRPGLQ
jgi:hypothetical protein